MDIIEKFIRENCWRFPKGYPDINNDIDRTLLNKILLESGFPTLEGEISEQSPAYRPFSYPEMTKPGREKRATTIADKIKNEELFAMSDGTDKVLYWAKPEYEELFANQELEKIKELGGIRVNKFPFFKDDSSNLYGLDSLLKDKDLGGLGKGSGTRIEDATLEGLRKVVEELVIENNGPITVKINGVNYPDIITVQTQKGTPKADFNLIDSSGNPVVFISHKKALHTGATPGDFFRWGGFTEYKDEPDVKTFISKLAEFLKKNNLPGIPRSVKFLKEIESNDLVKRIVYGRDFGGNFGVNNVTIAIQGAPKLEKQDDGSYNLTGEHYYYNGDNPEKDYRPILTGAFRSDKSMFGIPNLEAVAQPAAVAHRATNKYELKNGEFVKLEPKKQAGDSKDNN